WRHGRAGRVTLSDEDRTTLAGVGGWRRLNTLAHYGVRDSAVMALIPRQNDSFSSNCKGKNSYWEQFRCEMLAKALMFE
ncbi:hypothetical protein SK128_019612, partial [Halocaridina rubra]